MSSIVLVNTRIRAQWTRADAVVHFPGNLFYRKITGTYNVNGNCSSELVRLPDLPAIKETLFSISKYL